MEYDERIEKLPKWARQKFTTLMQRVEHYEAKLAEGPEDSNVFADPYSEAPRPLGRDTLIEFVPDKERRHRFRVSLDDQGNLTVQNDRLLAVRPRAANSIEIVQEDR